MPSLLMFMPASATTCLLNCIWISCCSEALIGPYLSHALVLFYRDKLVVHAVNQQDGHREFSVINLVPLRTRSGYSKSLPQHDSTTSVLHTWNDVLRYSCNLSLVMSSKRLRL
ncbi:hypothetical protein CRENBAI_020406 [Crenichthys baileyi]|uniref:Secreted protein n=1 Tax=Crenichthys baileyi TaxID=28760 RepID=A0AAV9SAW0_9TELE